MIITTTSDNSISDSILLEVKECDPLNIEGIICASADEILNKI